MGSFSMVHWLIVLVIVVLIFGTKKLANVGKDLGSAVKGFKDGMKEGDAAASSANPPAEKQVGTTIEGQSRTVNEKDNQS